MDPRIAIYDIEGGGYMRRGGVGDTVVQMLQSGGVEVSKDAKEGEKCARGIHDQVESRVL